MVDDMSRKYIEANSETALNSIFNFAEFVAETEFFADKVDVKLQEQYDRAWFEMELVNSLALAEWEQNGRPKEWGVVWKEKYKNDARETLCEFLAVVKKMT